MALLSRISRWFSGRAGVEGPVRDLPPDALSPGAIPIDPKAVFAPDPALIESYTHFDPQDEKNLRRVNDNKVFYKDIPYSRYLDEWQFHPGRIGGFLTTTRQQPKVVKTAKSILRCFVELPNGGLALYYPKTIRTARLQVNEPIYSGIAQGQLLAGFTRLIRDEVPGDKDHDWREIAHRIARSLLFPFEEGGVCVDGKIILEAPNFRACPEIILNGWIDALLHLHDYLQVAPDGELQEFLVRNLAALVELLPQFDAEDARLSRYSNVCPYQFRLHLKGAPRRSGPPRVAVEYLPVKPGHSAFCIPDLWSAGPELRKCIYENKIEKFRSSSLDVSLSVSGLHDIKLHVAVDCTRVTFDPGTYNASSTVPRRSLQSRTVLPQSRADGCSTFVIRSSEHALIPGCPTNFAKDGENFYHLYHVAALYELALITQERAQRKILCDFADKWLGYMQDPKHRSFGGKASFAEPSEFVRKIERFRALPNKLDFDQLRSHAAANT